MFRRADLTAAGLPRPEIDALCRDAVVVRRGVYVQSGDPEHLYARRCQAALAALRPGAALAGPSAAFHWDLPLVDEPEEIFLRGLAKGRYAGGVRLIHGADDSEPRGPARRTVLGRSRTEPVLAPAPPNP